MWKLQLILIGLLATTLCFGQEMTPGEEFIIFEQAKGQSAYTDSCLMEIAARVDKLGVSVRRIAIDTQALPLEITYLPTMVYQNPLGRSFYRGRYSSFDRVVHFIRTARRIPQRQADYNTGQVLTWEAGRASVHVIPKVTEVKGAGAQRVDNGKYTDKALRMLAEGMNYFEYRDSSAASFFDHYIYLDVHPYRNDFTEALTYALFSRYDCMTPNISQYDSAWTAARIVRKKLWRKLGAEMEAQMLSMMNDSSLGDAVHILPTSHPRSDWETWDLALPDADDNVKASLAVANIEIPKNWVYDGSFGSLPALQFRFPPPISHYTGEVKEIKGSIELGENNGLKGGDGLFKVATASVTMGLSDLDKAIRDKMINAADHPSASFIFERVEGDLDPLSFGEVNRYIVYGKFVLMGKQITLKAPTQAELILNASGEIRLAVTASFRLTGLWDTFGVEGPPGPAKASNQMLFDFHFLMKPDTEALKNEASSGK